MPSFLTGALGTQYSTLGQIDLGTFEYLWAWNVSTSDSATFTGTLSQHDEHAVIEASAATYSDLVVSHVARAVAATSSATFSGVASETRDAASHAFDGAIATAIDYSHLAGHPYAGDAAGFSAEISVHMHFVEGDPEDTGTFTGAASSVAHRKTGASSEASFTGGKLRDVCFQRVGWFQSCVARDGVWPACLQRVSVRLLCRCWQHHQ